MVRANNNILSCLVQFNLVKLETRSDTSPYRVNVCPLIYLL